MFFREVGDFVTLTVKCIGVLCPCGSCDMAYETETLLYFYAFMLQLSDLTQQRSDYSVYCANVS